ncbi:DNA-3-methyladenine glycosylase [Platysternon megacephalum]|uniref:Progonadoliberin-1 n=1 Tax=Platysternon megacephalum TaxID=55544 RepID=A0A4D9EAF6_9SAUR|nr:DNA-3-methyladenine glycosylase [Platysternon megacephalum]
METTRKLFVRFLMFILSVEICLAQHWSYGLQPGGKRDAENLVESFQEIASEMEKIGELQHFECTGPRQRSMLGGLKGALLPYPPPVEVTSKLEQSQTGRTTSQQEEKLELCSQLVKANCKEVVRQVGAGEQPV